MSDPVTNVEIEDVLSSIRRLVSAGESANAPEKPLETEASAPPPKFVLTPAFRVTEPDDLVESPVSEAAVSDDTTIFFDDEDAIEDIDTPEIVDKPSARDSLEATIAELEAAVVDQPDEWELDGSEVNTVPTWETVSYPPLDEVEDAVAVDEATPAQMRSDASEPSEDVSEVDASDPEVSHLWPQEVQEDPVEVAAFDAILNSGPFIAEDAVYTPDDHLPTPDGEDRFADVQNVETLTFVHNQPIQVPDDPAEDYGDELAADDDPVGEDDDLDAYVFGNVQGIDEDVLRQLVMDVVREELQGNLGERITRNVRKMVRREINRALDMQDFD